MSKDTTTKKTSSTDTVIARVEGTDKQGRPRILRIYYEDYEPKDDPKSRPHLELPAEAMKG